MKNILNIKMIFCKISATVAMDINHSIFVRTLQLLQRIFTNKLPPCN